MREGVHDSHREFSLYGRGNVRFNNIWTTIGQVRPRSNKIEPVKMI
jgi:hypothetical protein